MKHNLTVNITHICGHEEVHELIGAKEGSHRTKARIRELAKKDCTACVEKWLEHERERIRQEEIEDEMLRNMRWDRARCRYVIK